MPHLFKYVTAATGRVILQNRTLRWSTPPMLNDPFDMQFAFQLRIDRQAARVMALDKCWQLYNGASLDRSLNKLGRLVQLGGSSHPRMSREDFDRYIGGSIDGSIDEMRELIAKFSGEIKGYFVDAKILCLSDKPDSILMWSYYAQNHSGVVLRFTDGTPNNPLAMVRPIHYFDHIPSLLDNETLSDFLAGYGGIDKQRVMGQIVWTKSAHWAHEQEWRVCAGSGRSSSSHEDIPFNAKELDGVIFGVRTTEADRAALTNLRATRYPNVELLQASISPDTYELNIERAGNYFATRFSPHNWRTCSSALLSAAIAADFSPPA